jgi:hypothetical protein
MVTKRTPYDWRSLSSILYYLRHPSDLSLPINYMECESAIASAVRSGKVPVRGRLLDDHSMIPSAFERIEERLDHTAKVNSSLNRIIMHKPDRIRRSFRIAPWPEQTIELDNGPVYTFVEVEADWPKIEEWLHDNALSAGHSGTARAEESPPSRRGALPKYDWDIIRKEAFRLLDENGDPSREPKPHWKAQAHLEKKLLESCGKNEPSPSALREKLPGWVTEWRKQKQAAGN